MTKSNNENEIDDAETVVKLPIHPSRRTGFNQQGSIDLSSLTGTPVKFKDATFQDFGWLDLSAIDLDDNSWKNIGIRSKKAPEEKARVDSFRVSFRRKGFDTSEFPPCMDTDGNVLDGRGRIKAAKLNGELWMPVARYNREDKTARNTVTNGLRANQKKPSYMATFNDYIDAGTDLISKGELDATATAIDNCLYKDVKIENVIDNSICGQITKIRKGILKRSQKGGLILAMDQKDAHKWIKENLNLSKSEYVLLNASPNSNEDYTERGWRRAREAILNGKTVNIIFYTTANTPPEARSAVKKSTDYLEGLYCDCWKIVNSQLPDAFSLTIPEKRPFNFMGAIPQFVDTHKTESPHLVKLSKY